MSGINITGTSTDTGPGVRLKINITCEDLKPGYLYVVAKALQIPIKC